MFPSLLAAGRLFDLLNAIPLVIAISLVYSGTRHEQMADILPRALRMMVSITVFMAIAFGVLTLVSWWL